MDNIIEFKNFSFKYLNQSNPTLKNINLKIKAGEKILIAGSSGSGKSTLGNCLNGIVPFSKDGGFIGELVVDGIKPYEKGIFETSKHIGTVLQDQDGQFVGLSVGEDVAFLDENNCVSQDKIFLDVDVALGLVDMIECKDKSPQELSGGQKQRVALAGIMRASANILLFDEPLANLDPISGKNAMKLISKIHRESNKTIIVIEHRIEEVLEENFDRVIIINDGEIIADGTPEELLRKEIFEKNGLREPLYVEALRFANINFEKDVIYPLEKIGTINNKVKLQEWCKDVKGIEKNFNRESLILEKINFGYDKKNKILENINFSLKEGEILALLGNNGAGKSTLSKIITGIEKQDDGFIKLFDNNIENESVRKRGEKIGYVMQNPNHMLTQETVLKEVEFGLKIRGIKNYKEIAMDTLKICGIYEYRNWPINSLSYGQKKRVSIAAILALNPKLLILDEPTAGQDYKHYKEFMKFIKKISENKISIILITHDMHLALEYSDRAIVLSSGKIIADDTPINILSNKNIMKIANLRETSISTMAEILDIPSQLLLNYFIRCQNKEDKGEDRDV
ncbi:MAG: DUF3744 domain-containing protein [Cetobacterium sp.]